MHQLFPSHDHGGVVTLAGSTGPATTKFNVDANTAPGTDPVVPDANGQVTVTGAQVAAGTVGANVIRTDSLAANTYTIEIQRSTSNATTDSTKNGVSHFDSNYFLVDSNAFVTSTIFNNTSYANLGITVSGSTLTIQGSSASLSATNPAYVTIPSSSSLALSKTYKITANQSFAAADTAGNTWGITSSVNWANDMPFYIYAVSNSSAGSPETQRS